jgi:hypothetical protein
MVRGIATPTAKDLSTGSEALSADGLGWSSLQVIGKSQIHGRLTAVYDLFVQPGHQSCHIILFRKGQFCIALGGDIDDTRAG